MNSIHLIADLALLEAGGDETLAREMLAYALVRTMRGRSMGFGYHGHPSTRPPKEHPAPLGVPEERV